MREKCDGCGREINSTKYIIDNDMLLCLDCFVEIYRPTIEEKIGVVVFDAEEVDE